ncbi:MAG: hypothetical protein QOJ54_1892 [Aliidongia sp.]|jgi:hypothetical protein|nr:hypothetical protein [Aliidongia sp.]
MSARELILDLDRPIGPKGREITQLTLHEPLTGMVRSCERHLRSGFGQAELRSYQIELVAKCARIDFKQAEELPYRKLEEAATFVQAFANSKRPDGWMPDPDVPDELLIQLDEAVTVGGINHSSIFLREPTGGEVKKSESYLRGNFGLAEKRLSEIALIASVSGLSIPVIESLPISAHIEAYEYLENFLLAGRKTGQT